MILFDFFLERRLCYFHTTFTQRLQREIPQLATRRLRYLKKLFKFAISKWHSTHRDTAILFMFFFTTPCDRHSRLHFILPHAVVAYIRLFRNERVDVFQSIQIVPFLQYTALDSKYIYNYPILHHLRADIHHHICHML